MFRPDHLIRRKATPAQMDSVKVRRKELRAKDKDPELLTRCRYFQVERVLLNTEVHRELVPFSTGSNSFHVLLCVGGCGSVSGEKTFINFFKGDCIFVPADSEELKLHGKAQLLNVSC